MREGGADLEPGDQRDGVEPSRVEAASLGRVAWGSWPDRHPSLSLLSPSLRAQPPLRSEAREPGHQPAGSCPCPPQPWGRMFPLDLSLVVVSSGHWCLHLLGHRAPEISLGRVSDGCSQKFLLQRCGHWVKGYSANSWKSWEVIFSKNDHNNISGPVDISRNVPLFH